MKKIIAILSALTLFLVLPISSRADTIDFNYGDGTDVNPYAITTAEQLAALADEVNNGNTDYNMAHYMLGADIDLSGYGEPYNHGKGWIPIGNDSNPFYGYFNGDGHKIYNLYINNDQLTTAGLFGSISTQISPSAPRAVSNLAVINVNITLSPEGGLRQAYSTAGAIVGSAQLCDITGCYSTGYISAGIAGGIVGSAGGYVLHISNPIFAQITKCYSSCAVVGNIAAGGIAGMAQNAELFACYSTGEIFSTSSAGGIVGTDAIRGTLGSIDLNIENCAALNPKISGSDANIGRIVSKTVTTLTNNIAFEETLNSDDEAEWSNIGASSIDGENISAAQIEAGGTLGDRFIAADGWIIEDGKLPRLFDQFDANSLTITSAGQDGANPNVVVTYDAGENVSGTIFIAAYNTITKKLVKVSSDQNIIPISYNKKITFENFLDGISAGHKIKAFAWSNIDDTIMPLGAHFEFSY